MTVHHKWNDGTRRQFLMLKGISQGCPLSPLFASFVVARLLEQIDKLLRERAMARLTSGNPGGNGYGSISHLLSYVDDVSTCVYLLDLAFSCNTLKTHSTSLGCFVNTSKTRILTSCDGTSPLARITDANPSLGLSIKQSITTFSNTPNPLDPTGPPLPVELTSGFHLLGHLVGSVPFAQDFFTTCLTTINRCITSLSDSISDNQTRLHLFSQCIIQKIPHLLSSDVLYHLPQDDQKKPWDVWNGQLTSATDSIIHTFLESLLQLLNILDHAILITQLGISAGGLGLLCPQTRAAPDFVISMTSAIRCATLGFRLHKHLNPHLLHPSLTDLFQLSTNGSSLILQRFHCLLPHIAAIGCSPSTPHATRTTAFLTLVSPKSAQNPIQDY
jgi:hypothetical protein